MINATLDAKWRPTHVVTFVARIKAVFAFILFYYKDIMSLTDSNKFGCRLKTDSGWRHFRVSSLSSELNAFVFSLEMSSTAAKQAVILKVSVCVY